jgi:chromosome partitioning protein
MLMLKSSGLDHLATAELIRPMKQIRKRLNPELRISAVTMVDTDAATIFSRKLAAQFTDEYPDALVATVPHSIRAAEAPAVQQSMLDYAPDNPVTLAYYRLAAALVPRLGFEWVVGPRDVVNEGAK